MFSSSLCEPAREPQPACLAEIFAIMNKLLFSWNICSRHHWTAQFIHFLWLMKLFLASQPNASPADDQPTSHGPWQLALQRRGRLWMVLCGGDMIRNDGGARHRDWCGARIVICVMWKFHKQILLTRYSLSSIFRSFFCAVLFSCRLADIWYTCRESGLFWL